jgi:hypothetical protein
LRIGGVGLFGLNLPRLFQAEAAARPPATPSAARVKSCILIYYYGGPSHLDTWDLKPHAPAEVRGEFKSIATPVPGLRVCEHLPRAARLADRLAIVRSMHHHMRNHNAAAVESLCGRTPLKGDLELLANDRGSDFPCYGSALTYLLPRKSQVPAHVALPHVMHNVVMLPGQTAGFLGSAFDPLQVSRDPSAPDFQLGELELPGGMTLDGLEDRESLLRLIDRQLRGAEAASTKVLDQSYERAFTLLRSDAVRRSFDLGREHPGVRDRYGRNKFGQSLLLARRLVEAGVRFVSVYDKSVNGQLENWDSHENNFHRLKDDLLPPTDQAFSAFIEDLATRGLLDSTLVIALAEFGRSPLINKHAGRDHWPDCFSVVLAGGGVKGGMVYGASDKLGAHPDLAAVTPGDLAATLFWRFGLDAKTQLRDFTGRPYALADGEPIRELFA